MLSRRTTLVSLLLLSSLAAAGKNKKKIILPTDVLQAETVLVVIDPDAGEAIESPMANRTARNNVETAIMNWGRFRLAQTAYDADLIIAVRKGNGRMAQPTIGGIPDDRPVILNPSESGPRVGGQAGTPPPLSQPTPGAQQQGPHPQVEMGQSEDMFAVYRGKRENPLDSPPVWRYVAKDGLRSPGVPAVDEFRKVLLEAEKQQANNP